MLHYNRLVNASFSKEFRGAALFSTRCRGKLLPLRRGTSFQPAFHPPAQENWHSYFTVFVLQLLWDFWQFLHLLASVALGPGEYISPSMRCGTSGCESQALWQTTSRWGLLTPAASWWGVIHPCHLHQQLLWVLPGNINEILPIYLHPHGIL